VFPPFPGDTITLLGAWLALEGVASPAAVWATVTAASALGCGVTWAFGAWLSRRARRPGIVDRLPRWLPAEALARFEAQYRRWGLWFIALNRFLPVSRALFFVLAGFSGMKPGPVLALGTFSAAVWNALLLAAAWSVGHSLPALQRLYERYQHIALVVLGLAVLAALVFWVRRRAGRGSPRASGKKPPATRGG